MLSVSCISCQLLLRLLPVGKCRVLAVVESSRCCTWLVVHVAVAYVLNVRMVLARFPGIVSTMLAHDERVYSTGVGCKDGSGASCNAGMSCKVGEGVRCPSLNHCRTEGRTKACMECFSSIVGRKSCYEGGKHAGELCQRASRVANTQGQACLLRVNMPPSPPLGGWAVFA